MFKTSLENASNILPNLLYFKEILNMSHHSSLLSQTLSLVPRHIFQKLEALHKTGRSSRKFGFKEQCTVMAFIQLAAQRSMRDGLRLVRCRKQAVPLGPEASCPFHLRRRQQLSSCGFLQRSIRRNVRPVRAKRAKAQVPLQVQALHDRHQPLPVSVPVSKVSKKQGRGHLRHVIEVTSRGKTSRLRRVGYRAAETGKRCEF